jgi:hypothetical protein
MGKRFSNLNAALKYLRAAGSDTDTIPSAPAGSQLAEYQDFVAKKRVVNYTRQSSSNPGNLDQAGIKPFALPTADTDVYIVDLSSRAKAALAQAGLTAEILNHNSVDGDSKIVRGFIPARATVTVIPEGDGVITTSKITGAKYRKKNNVSYTFPFGRGADDTTFSATKSAILAGVATGDSNRGVSFKPEIFV